MKLHDNTIGHIAKLIQMAILTGTDIIDHLRMLEIKKDEHDMLVLQEKYVEIFDNSLQKMIENAVQQKSDQELGD
jgi:3-hydroxy-3-methylglutaryl CoA synthase